MRMRMAVAFLSVLLYALSVPLPSLSLELPQFRLGFEILATLIPEVAGEPLEEEHHNPINGDGLQQTSAGLMVWRKADNWTAFTDGSRSWVNGPLGLQLRGNCERFGWELGLAAAGETVAITQEVCLSARPPDTGQRLPPQLPATSEPSTFPASPIATPGAATSPDASATPASGQLSTPTAAVTATAAPTAVATPTRTVPSPAPSKTPAPALPYGGISSPTPAGDWVTSSYASTTYYTTRDNASRWQNWAPDNRVWFASEAALLAAYPGRVRDVPAMATPTRYAVPGNTPPPPQTPRPAATQPSGGVSGGIMSPTPAGEWVTSSYPTTTYYTTRDDTAVWGKWSEGNRIWFQTEAALLAAYPGRIRK